MKEFIEKLIGRLEEELIPLNQEITKYFYKLKDTDNPKYIYAVGRSNALTDFKYTIKQLAREYETEHIVDLCNQFCDKADEILQKKNNGWIPCSERLPEDDSICIVTVEYQNNETTEVDYGWFDRFECCWYVGIQEFRTSNILAWQPLPPAFKPKGE